MREHHPLGVTRRAARVNDGRQILAGDLRFAAENLLLLVGAASALHQAVPAEHPDLLGRRDDRIERDQKLEIGQRCEHLENFVGLMLAAHDDAARLAVADLVFDLSRSQRGVQRNVGGAGRKDGLVGDQPFVAILGKNRDAVARVARPVRSARRPRGRPSSDIRSRLRS